MLVDADTFVDDEKTKVNITMKDGTEFKGVDLVGGTTSGVFGFVWSGGARFVNQNDVLYFDMYLED